MEKYKHITTYETILNEHDELTKQVNHILDLLEEKKKDYDALVKYYYSEQWHKDLEDDEKGLIPKDLHRGVLSEDAIYNLMGDYYETSIRFLELALKIQKREW